MDEQQVEAARQAAYAAVARLAGKGRLANLRARVAKHTTRRDPEAMPYGLEDILFHLAGNRASGITDEQYASYMRFPPSLVRDLREALEPAAAGPRHGNASPGQAEGGVKP